MARNLGPKPPTRGMKTWYLFQYRQVDGPVVSDKGVENPDNYDFSDVPMEEIWLVEFDHEKLMSAWEKKNFLRVKDGHWSHSETGAKDLVAAFESSLGRGDRFVLDELKDAYRDQIYKLKKRGFIDLVHEPVEFYKNGNVKKSQYRVEYRGRWMSQGELAERAEVVGAYEHVVWSSWGRSKELESKYWKDGSYRPPVRPLHWNNPWALAQQWAGGPRSGMPEMRILHNLFVRETEKPTAVDLTETTPKWAEKFVMETIEERETRIQEEKEAEAAVRRAMEKEMQREEDGERKRKELISQLEPGVQGDFEDSEDWMKRLFIEEVQPPKRPKQGKLGRKIKKLGMDPGDTIYFRYSDGCDVVHYNETHHDWTLEQTDTCESVANAVCSGLFPEELSLLIDYIACHESKKTGDIDQFEEWVAAALRKAPWDAGDGLLRFHLKQYDHKRGWCELESTLSLKVEEVLKWGNRVDYALGGYEATLRDDDGAEVKFIVTHLV